MVNEGMETPEETCKHARRQAYRHINTRGPSTPWDVATTPCWPSKRCCRGGDPPQTPTWQTCARGLYRRTALWCSEYNGRFRCLLTNPNIQGSVPNITILMFTAFCILDNEAILFIFSLFRQSIFISHFLLLLFVASAFICLLVSIYLCRLWERSGL